MATLASKNMSLFSKQGPNLKPCTFEICVSQPLLRYSQVNNTREVSKGPKGPKRSQKAPKSPIRSHKIQKGPKRSKKV